MGFLQYEQEGNVVTLTMNRPDSRNPVGNAESVNAFVEACQRINGDGSVRAVILTGSGSAFSAGGDLRMMMRGVTEGQALPSKIRNDMVHGVQRIAQALYYLEVPVIAAINGAAIGAGLDIACMCDLRIASTRAKFSERFVRMGMVAGDGGAWLLPRLIGRAAASELAFTGDTIDAAEALRLGIVSRVVEPERLLDEAHGLARRIAANPGTVLRLTKQLIRESDNASFSDVLQSSASAQAIAMHSPSHREAVLAFAEKRVATFGDD